MIKENTALKSIKCIVYGLGNEYQQKRFQAIRNRNRFVKPTGGLWASPINCLYGWKEAATDMEIGDFETSFEITIEGNILVIDSFEDLEKLPHITEELGPFAILEVPDFEALLLDGVQAIFLTEKGQNETRLTTPRNLYGWDCESVLVLDKECIKP